MSEDSRHAVISSAIPSDGLDISHFFERPILIKTLEWDDNTNLFDSTNYWAEYFSHRAIWPKLLGFSRFVSDLEIEFRVNGSPFRFSDILVSYRPLFQPDVNGYLASYSGGHLPEDGCISSSANFSSVQPSSSALSIMARSQRQSVYLQVSNSVGGKMVLPFVYPFEAVRMTSLQHDPSNPTSVANMKNTTFYKSLLSLGYVTMESLATLRNTQATSGVGVTIDVFVRATNIKVWLSSGVSALQPQAGKKAKGSESIKPSTISTAIAAGARAFKDIPVIGPFATVGSMVADGVTMILQAFGFTPMAINVAAQPVFKMLSFVESSLTKPRCVTSLSLDHENQVSIDPTIIGGPSSDELALASFAARSTIADRCYFGSSCAVNDTIFLMPIHPMLGISTSISTGKSLPCVRYQLLPCAFAATHFRYWRGTAVVKLRAIKTNFHRGRLRIAWEPEFGTSSGISTTDFTSTHEGYQQMLTWDLDSTDCVEMKIGFASRTARLTVPAFTTAALNLSPQAVGSTWKTNSEASSGPITNSFFVSDNYLDYCNGFLRISVSNRLQSPDVTYPVPIVVSVHFEDLELYDPTDCGVNALSMNNIFADYSSNSLPDIAMAYSSYNGEEYSIATRPLWPDTFYPQGNESKIQHVFEEPSSADDLVYEGELFTSLRALAARETYYDTILYEIPSVQTIPELTYDNLVYHSIPPTICTSLLPWRPSAFGTTGSMRSTSYTLTPSATGGGVPTASLVCADNVSRTFAHSKCRTPFVVLLQECFVGQRGSFNWKFMPGPTSGVEIDSITVSRSNTFGSFARLGSYPRVQRISPLCSGYIPDADNEGFVFSTEKRHSVVPLSYDTGPVNAGAGIQEIGRQLRLNIGLKLAEIRGYVNSLLGNFAAGAVTATSFERLVAGIRYPYFSLAKFLPCSSTGWMHSYSNAEFSSNMRLTVVTKPCSFRSVGASPATTDTNWRLYVNTPGRNYVSVQMVCSAGDDWSVANFVNVPSLYINGNINGINSSTQTNV